MSPTADAGSAAGPDAGAPIIEVSGRTYPVEITVKNADYSLRSGLTATLRIAIDQVTAHRLSPALFALDDLRHSDRVEVDEGAAVLDRDAAEGVRRVGREE